MFGLLPRVFRLKQALDLVRLGREHDGGYLCSAFDVNSAEVLVSFGVNEDWSFEEDFYRRTKAEIFAYDSSINGSILLRRVFVSLFKIYNPRRFSYAISKYLSYKHFFSKALVHHIEKHVGLDCDEKSFCTFFEVMENVDGSNIFLKIDIEGCEYRILDNIITAQDRLVGLVIEFHDLDIHLEKVTQFVEEINLPLIHIHANNYSPVRASDKLPITVELTFGRSSFVAEKNTLPHDLDLPNDSGRPEIQLSVRDS